MKNKNSKILYSKGQFNSQLISKPFPTFYLTDQLKEQPPFFSHFQKILLCFFKPVQLGAQVHSLLLHSCINNYAYDSYLLSPPNIPFTRLLNKAFGSTMPNSSQNPVHGNSISYASLFIAPSRVPSGPLSHLHNTSEPKSKQSHILVYINE